MPIGIDLGGTKIAGVRMAEDGTILSENRLPTPRNDYRATLDAIVELVASLDSGERMPIGIGTPGALRAGYPIGTEDHAELQFRVAEWQAAASGSRSVSRQTPARGQRC